MRAFTMDQNPCEPLNQQEKTDLKDSLGKHGFLPGCPIVRSAGPACKGQIIDGFHRQKYCDELDITPSYVEQPCANELEYKALQIIINLRRRQLTPGQRARLVAVLGEIKQQELTQFGHPERSEHLEDLADESSVTGISDGNTGQPETGDVTVDAPTATVSTGTLTARARSANVSTGTQSKVEQITDPDLQDQLDAGASVSSTYTEHQRRHRADPEADEGTETTTPTIALADEAVDNVATYRPIDQLLSIIRTAMSLLTDISNEQMTADTEACACLHEFVRAALHKMEPLEPVEEPDDAWSGVGGPT